MRGLKRLMSKKLGEMGFNAGGGVINWFPGHMAAATRAIRDRLKLSDLVIEVRDSRIPLSSANLDLQPLLANKRRVIALNKRDLANPNMMKKWIQHFESCKQDCVSINAHSKSSVIKLLELVEWKLKEAISREPTLLVMVVGVPNVGKSALINSIHQITSSRFPSKYIRHILYGIDPLDFCMICCYMEEEDFHKFADSTIEDLQEKFGGGGFPLHTVLSVPPLF